MREPGLTGLGTSATPETPGAGTAALRPLLLPEFDRRAVLRGGSGATMRERAALPAPPPEAGPSRGAGVATAGGAAATAACCGTGTPMTGGAGTTFASTAGSGGGGVTGALSGSGKLNLGPLAARSIPVEPKSASPKSKNAASGSAISKTNAASTHCRRGCLFQGARVFLPAMMPAADSA